MVDTTIREQDETRAQHWALIARLLVAAPDRAVLDALAGLDGDETPLGQAYAALAQAAAQADAKDVTNEYFELFIGVGRGELLPYASFYLTGFLNERPLADLRSDLAAMGIARAEDRHDPEDHIATLCEIMSGLASSTWDASVLGCGAAGEAGFFARHIEPWAATFFDDLATAPSARFYKHVARVASIFLGIESRSFELERGGRRQAVAGMMN